jgi:PPOX class probable FMN-dependent enzyme
LKRRISEEQADMSFTRFAEQVTSLDELRALIGTPGELVIKKELPQLDEHMRRFIAHSPFVIMSTHDAAGRCDASPRGDAAGFVQVIDERTLLIPDRRGNKRIDSLQNILATGRIGSIFLVPGVGETLRVNGRAAIVKDEAWLAPLTAQGQRPLVGIAVEAEECYLQCAKALMRSKLWESKAPPSPDQLASFAQMLVDQTKLAEYDTAKMQALLDGAYQRLY